MTWIMDSRALDYILNKWKAKYIKCFEAFKEKLSDLDQNFLWLRTARKCQQYRKNIYALQKKIVKKPLKDWDKYGCRFHQEKVFKNRTSFFSPSFPGISSTEVKIPEKTDRSQCLLFMSIDLLYFKKNRQIIGAMTPNGMTACWQPAVYFLYLSTAHTVYKQTLSKQFIWHHGGDKNGSNMSTMIDFEPKHKIYQQKWPK